MRQLTALEAFRSTVRRYPDSVAIETLDGRSLSYRAVDERTDALAGALDDRLGDARCAVVSENRVAAIEAMLAAMKRGRANVQLSAREKAGQLAAMLETGRADGVVFDAAAAEQVADLSSRVDLAATIGVGEAAGALPDAEAYESVLAEAADRSGAVADPAGETPEAAVFFTSGTTSAPRAVLVDQQQYWLAANQPALEMSLTAADLALVCTPWHHGVTSLTWIMAHLLVGATLVVQPAFEPVETLRAIDDFAVTGLLAVPTQLEALLEAHEEAGADVETLSYVRTGGAVVPDVLIERVRETFTDGVYNTYGQTEAIIDLSFAYPWEQDDHPGTIGNGTFLWELRVVEAADVDEEPDPDRVVDPGETGEILARGPRMLDGYVDQPAASERLFVDGWLRTGDVARTDADGYLVVIDRVDNMIVSGGENVYPEEVQRALKDHPAVRDAGVVGLPDETWGEVVAAAVVVEDGVTEEDLDAHCRAHDRLADFKRPRRYHLLPAEKTLPRTATGSLRRGEVCDMFEA